MEIRRVNNINNINNLISVPSELEKHNIFKILVTYFVRKDNQEPYIEILKDVAHYSSDHVDSIDNFTRIDYQHNIDEYIFQCTKKTIAELHEMENVLLDLLYDRIDEEQKNVKIRLADFKSVLKKRNRYRKIQKLI